MRRWSAGAKVVAGSALCVILGFGLCGGPAGMIGANGEGLSVKLGTILFCGGWIGLLVGAVMCWVMKNHGGEDV